MKIYLDTSAIIKLYYPETESERLSKWIVENRLVIPFSLFHNLEMYNAFALKVFRGEITGEQCLRLSESLAADRISGAINELHADWNRVLQKAVEIARMHTPNLGNRSLDIRRRRIRSEISGNEKRVGRGDSRPVLSRECPVFLQTMGRGEQEKGGALAG